MILPSRVDPAEGRLESQRVGRSRRLCEAFHAFLQVHLLPKLERKKAICPGKTSLLTAAAAS